MSAVKAKQDQLVNAARIRTETAMRMGNWEAAIGNLACEDIRTLLVATELLGPQKKRTKCLFPDDLVLDDKARSFAEKKGFRGSQIDEMWERFDAYHRSGGTESADWSASWRTWVLNQIRFGERPQAQAIPSRPCQPSLVDLAERTDLAPAPRRGARY